MQHRHGHAAWTWACTYGLWHEAWTWTCSIDMDMDMPHRHGHIAWTWTWTWTYCRPILDLGGKQKILFVLALAKE
jgi:hypothetical protein